MDKDMVAISWHGNDREYKFVADIKRIGDTSHKDKE